MKIDESVILRFYERRRPRKTKPLEVSLSEMTLTNSALGIGDTLILTSLSRISARDGVATSIYSFSSFFETLMAFNPAYTFSMKPFWVAASPLCYTFNLGNGHFSQRLQRAFGFTPDLRPGGYIVVPDTIKMPGQVAVHLEAGPWAKMQKKHVHPRAREVYPETLRAIQRS